jgi:hypothetical protein
MPHKSDRRETGMTRCLAAERHGCANLQMVNQSKQASDSIRNRPYEAQIVTVRQLYRSTN